MHLGYCNLFELNAHLIQDNVIIWQYFLQVFLSPFFTICFLGDKELEIPTYGDIAIK